MAEEGAEKACKATVLMVNIATAAGMQRTLRAVAMAGFISGCAMTPKSVSQRASPLNARSQKFGETCNISPVLSFVQPDVPPEHLTTVAVSGVAEPTTNQFRVLGPWSTSNLIPIYWNVSQWTGFAPIGDNRASQLGVRDDYGASALQLQGTTVGFWDNGLFDRLPYGGMQAGCWFENEATCPGQFGAAAFPEASSRIRVSVDLRVPYDGTVPHGPGGHSFDFVYANFIFRSTCPGGFIACGADKCSNGQNDQLTLSIALYDGRYPSVTYPSVKYDAYNGTPVGVPGPLSGDRIDGTGGFFDRAGNSAGFQTRPFSDLKHFEVVITPESFGRVLARIQTQFPNAMQSWDPHSYRMVTSSVVDEYSQPVPAVDGDHAQLGMTLTNFNVVSKGPSNDNVVAVSRRDLLEWAQRHRYPRVVCGFWLPGLRRQRANLAAAPGVELEVSRRYWRPCLGPAGPHRRQPAGLLQRRLAHRHSRA